MKPKGGGTSAFNKSTNHVCSRYWGFTLGILLRGLARDGFPELHKENPRLKCRMDENRSNESDPRGKPRCCPARQHVNFWRRRVAFHFLAARMLHMQWPPGSLLKTQALNIGSGYGLEPSRVAFLVGVVKRKHLFWRFPMQHK